VTYDIHIDEDDDLLDVPSEETIDFDRPIPCEFLTGNAGTGKTFQTLALHEQDPSYAWLTATTGIAAVNLGATTVHSALRYSDTDSLRDLYISGRLTRILHEIALKKHRLLVEEASMIDARQLDIWYRGVVEVNRYRDVKVPFGLTLVGDFGQLPPVRAPWAFEASCWPEFASRTTRLTKVWRQDSGPFLDALNAARVGNGGLAAEILTSIGITWHTSTNQEFDGTTILSRNQQVNRYNDLAMDRVPGPRIIVAARRWGKQRSEWGENQKTHEWGIPERAELKVGAYVMILSNAPDFSWVNGDCGHIVAFESSAFHIHLKRTDEVVEIRRIVRGVEQYSKPEDPYTGRKIHKLEDRGEFIPEPHYRGWVRRYVLGQVEFFPIKLAYASTVHKSQGLSLDIVQIDFRDQFFREPAMLYVALSRCRTWQGLRLVGMREVFARQCRSNPRVREWL
jgi:ATP-dependent DNA helicase PIF1